MAANVQYSINEVTESHVIIRDEGGNNAMSVTNGAEEVVSQLRKSGVLKDGMRLAYYDSLGDLDEIVWDKSGNCNFKLGFVR